MVKVLLDDLWQSDTLERVCKECRKIHNITAWWFNGSECNLDGDFVLYLSIACSFYVCEFAACGRPCSEQLHVAPVHLEVQSMMQRVCMVLMLGLARSHVPAVFSTVEPDLVTHKCRNDAVCEGIVESGGSQRSAATKPASSCCVQRSPCTGPCAQWCTNKQRLSGRLQSRRHIVERFECSC